jgi:hypothetical protein
MRERIKSVILLLLITLSIILTLRLLFGLPPLETATPPSFEEVSFGELQPLEEQILPRLLLGANQEWQLLDPWHEGYSQTWDTIQRLFVFSDPPETTSAGPFENEIDGLVVRVLFPMQVPAAVWGSGSISGLILTEVIWRLNDPEVIWLLEAEKGWTMATLTAMPDSVSEEIISGFIDATSVRHLNEDELPELGLSVSDELLIPVETIFMAPRSVIQETLDMEKLVRSIFIDTALVRTIEERDGALIYTDGQKGLRIFDYGEIEFSAPKSEPGMETMDKIPALRRTAQYLQLMGGWPQHLYLSALTREEGPSFLRRQWDIYEVSFLSAQHGVRLISSREPVLLRFTDRGVTYYRRQISILGSEIEEPRIMVDPLQALLVAKIVMEQDDKDAVLYNISAVYYLRGTGRPPATAQPVWALDFGDKTALVHGSSGSFLTWLE